MDFEAYETFLENLSSVMRGINCLIQKANNERGKHFVWSPIAPDIVVEGALDYVGWWPIYTDIKDIPQVILKCLNNKNLIVELAYTNTHNGSHYLLSSGH